MYVFIYFQSGRTKCPTGPANSRRAGSPDSYSRKQSNARSAGGQIDWYSDRVVAVRPRFLVQNGLLAVRRFVMSR